MSRITKSLNLLHPQYWLTWLGLGLLRVSAFLPFSTMMSIGRLLGRLIFKLAKRRVAIARKNLSLCFPELDEKKQQALLLQYFDSVGMSLMDMAIAWWWSEKRLNPLVSITGYEHLDNAIKEKKGIILYTGHFAGVDISVRIMCTRAPGMVMYRPNENPVIQKTIVKHRESFTLGVIRRDDVRKMVQALKANKAVWFAPDQNYGHKNSVFSDFFGIPAATNISASRFVKLSDALILPFVVYRKDEGGYHLQIEKALQDFPGESVRADADRLNTVLESFVRQHPAQYNWMHRRFKDRPNTEARFY